MTITALTQRCPESGEIYCGPQFEDLAALLARDRQCIAQECLCFGSLPFPDCQISLKTPKVRKSKSLTRVLSQRLGHLTNLCASSG